MKEGKSLYNERPGMNKKHLCPDTSLWTLRISKCGAQPDHRGREDGGWTKKPRYHWHQQQRVSEDSVSQAFKSSLEMTLKLRLLCPNSPSRTSEPNLHLIKWSIICLQLMLEGTWMSAYCLKLTRKPFKELNNQHYFLMGKETRDKEKRIDELNICFKVRMRSFY